MGVKFGTKRPDFENNFLNHFIQLKKLSYRSGSSREVSSDLRLNIIYIKQGHALKNWVEGLSDQAFYPWESPKEIRLKSVNPRFATEQKKVSIHR